MSSSSRRAVRAEQNKDAVKFRGAYLDGRFILPKTKRGGRALSSISPWDRSVVMNWHETPTAVEAAFRGAARAFPAWAALTFEERLVAIRRLEDEFRAASDELEETISIEMGKSPEDATEELRAVLAKFEITIEAAREFRLREKVFDAGPGAVARVSHHPHGVLFIPGPYNFPLHIPNGHWVPALLAGNTVVFKPSEATPLIGQRIAELFARAKFPAGVFQMVQGGAVVAKRALAAKELAGVLFTGSYATGVAIRRALVERTEVIDVLEMGGNNPVIVLPDAKIDRASDEIFRGATITTGQRCTSVRRLYLVGAGRQAGGDELIASLAAKFASASLPPVANEAAMRRHDRIERAIKRAKLKVLARGIVSSSNGFFVPPLLVQVEKRNRELDFIREESFLPILFVERVATLTEAIEAANATEYGLAASIFTQKRGLYEQCRRGIRAGIINWNRATIGASGRLPFGGLGHSGNYRPAGNASYEYCVHPVSSLEVEK